MKNFLKNVAISGPIVAGILFGTILGCTTPTNEVPAWKAQADFILQNGAIYYPNGNYADAGIFLENGDFVQIEYLYEYFNPELNCKLWEDGSVSCE
jgi:hypothetical protein